MTAQDQRTVGLALRVGGAGLLFSTAGIHLDLYLTGYRHIATIGPLFLLQVIAAFALGGAVLALPRRLVVLSAALFPLTTLGGYILSLWFGLFGFNEVRTTAGIVAGVIEILAFLLLGAWTVWFAPTPVAGIRPASSLDRLEHLAPRAFAPLGFLAFLALLLAEVASGPTTGNGSVAASSSKSTGPTIASGPVVHVVIQNFAFLPSRVVAKPGEQIAVKNTDGVAHTFTAMPGSSPQGSFNSGDINPGQTGSVTAPSAAGKYAFYCSIHPFMTGTLTVS